MEESKRERRLRKEPDGFPIEDTRSCKLCRETITPETGWYDKYGMKCRDCQRALKSGAIPSYVFLNDDSFYKTWQLKSKFSIPHMTMKKLIKQGRLFPRMITAESGGVHGYLFLKTENPGLVAPEKWNPVRKSHDRHRKKVSRRESRQRAKEMVAELRANQKKVTKKYNKSSHP